MDYGTFFLKDSLVELAENRSQLERLKSQYNAAKEAFRVEMAEVTDRIEQLSIRSSSLEQEIKSAAVAQYEDGCTDGKTVNPWVKIQVRTVIEFDDESAFEWACKSGVALSLDKATFKKLAKTESVRDIPAKVEKEPTATIASDLSELLWAINP